ncbi:amidohydrolase family protein [Hydrogenophaga sp.]|uniref:amidohydrolase family protein n=1 Tax=Hydrogenophaga sp. TaxID=1904254 RepID=UPI003564918E
MSISLRNVSAWSAIALATAACGGGGEDVSSGVVIYHATIVDTRDGSLVTGKTLVVNQGKIQKITSDKINAVGTAQSADATGKFVVPGYMDMHAHVMDGAKLSTTYWPLLVANGVTGVREMSGSTELIAQVKQLNADSAAGLVDAPEIVQVHGGFFAGAPTTDAAGRAFVQEKKALGADFIKLVAGAPPFVMAVLDEAKKAGLGVVGHLPAAVPTDTLSNGGWRVVEHLGAGWGSLIDCARNAATLRSDALSRGYAPPFPSTYTINPRLYDVTKNAEFYQGILDNFDQVLCKAQAQTFAKNGTWHVPTLIRLSTQNFSTDSMHTQNPNLKYVDKERRALWAQMADQFDHGTHYDGLQDTPAVSPANAKTLRDFYQLELDTTRLLKQNGVKIMAGSDSANIAIWTVPGFSLHQEFGELAKAGLSPLEVLQSTTLTPAEFLGRQSAMGTVEVGKNANLVLLDANPVTDVSNLSKISGVVLKGRFFAKDKLEQMKSGVAQAYADRPMGALSAAIDVNHVH